MLEPEQDDAWHDEIEIAGAERSRKPHLRGAVIADAHKVDVGLAVDLAAGEKKHVNPTLTGAIEQFAPALGEEIMVAAFEDRHVRPAAAACPREQCSRRRDR